MTPLSFLNLLPSASFAAVVGNSLGILPFLSVSCLTGSQHHCFVHKEKWKKVYTWLAGVAKDIRQPWCQFRGLKLIRFQLRRKWSENLKRLFDNQGYWTFFVALHLWYDLADEETIHFKPESTCYSLILDRELKGIVWLINTPNRFYLRVIWEDWLSHWMVNVRLQPVSLA